MRHPGPLKFGFYVLLLVVAVALAGQFVPVYRQSAWLARIGAIPKRAGVRVHGAAHGMQSVSLPPLPLGLIGVEFKPARPLPALFPFGERLEDLSYREPQAVHLCYTEFSDEQIPLLLEAPSLEVVVLDGTKVTDAGLTALRKAPRLAALHLDYTHITDIGVEIIGEPGRLSYVHLRGTQITDRALPHLAKLQSLVYLDLSATPITGAGLRHLQTLRHFTRLRLDDSEIGDADVEVLCGFTLRELSLARTRITDHGLKALTRLSSLCILCVTGTQVTPEGLEEFRRLRPEVDFVEG